MIDAGEVPRAGNTAVAGQTATPAAGAGAGADAPAAPDSHDDAGTTPPAPRERTYLLGADVTDQEPAPETTRAKLLEILKSHGFNAVRLRTFVDPKARDGYDKTNGYGDLAHTVAFAKQIKAADLSFLLDFHYSNNWADPGKQCVPIGWQNFTTIAELATAVHDYTKDAISQLTTAGARPDLVQIGNEITPGMLLHRCDDGGQPIGENRVTGSASNWENLGKLLQAGATAVREVDPRIAIALHIDRGGDKPADTPGAALKMSIDWLANALKYVDVDAFGLSCYQKYQGDPNDAKKTQAGWTATFSGLATKFPEIKLFAAEYGPMQREINDVVYDLPGERGLGTFNWEPTTRGDWNTGHDLLRRDGDGYAAQPDLALYDQMKRDYASRL
jgi:arabinogalactan endo-1,4-beta-galactosidase